MIIECPACNTRYDIKAELPPEGRTVRCAKCGTVWRAMPSRAEDEPEEAVLAEAVREREGTGNTVFERQASHEDAAHSEPAAHEDGAAEDEAGDQEETHVLADLQQEPEFAESDFKEEGEDTGKVSWFSSFRRRRKLKEKDAGQDDADGAVAQGGAETIPFPRANVAVEAQEPERQDARTLDEARQAVRRVFFGLGDGRPSFKTGAISVNGAGPRESGDNSGPAEGETKSRWARMVKSGEVQAGPGGLRAASEVEDVSGQGNIGDAPDDERGAADAALRDAMKAHFQSQARENAGPSEPEEELARKLETHLRATTVTATQEEAIPGTRAARWGKVPPADDEEMIAAEPPVEVEEPADSRDEDAAFDQRLYREIEETQEKSGEAARRGGGLALAAAWGLFLCIAGGLIVGFFAFRDMIADASPGLAPLYRTLGMPVTVQPLVFEGVKYDWTTSDNKPVLTVSGSVFNQARRKVKVPEFTITIKDQDPALDREYSANLRMNGSKIRSKDRAEFDIELVSPNPTVTAVELELRNVR